MNLFGLAKFANELRARSRAVAMLSRGALAFVAATTVSCGRRVLTSHLRGAGARAAASGFPRPRSYSDDERLLPSVPHVEIDRKDLKENLLVIGDVHGCFDELQALLNQYGFPERAEDTTVIYVGDLVNKGPKSAEVVKFVRTSGALCVRGNHDNAALALAIGIRDPYKGSDWVNSLSDEDIQFLQELPYSLTIRGMNLIIVHAGLVPGVPLAEQKLKNLFKMRNVVEKDADGDRDSEVPAYVALEKPTDGEPWAKVWKGPEHVVFGHDAKRKLQDKWCGAVAVR